MSDNVQDRIFFTEEIQITGWGESKTGGPWIRLRLPNPDALRVFRDLSSVEPKKPVRAEVVLAYPLDQPNPL